MTHYCNALTRSNPLKDQCVLCVDWIASSYHRSEINVDVIISGISHSTLEMVTFAKLIITLQCNYNYSAQRQTMNRIWQFGIIHSLYKHTACEPVSQLQAKPSQFDVATPTRTHNAYLFTHYTTRPLVTGTVFPGNCRLVCQTIEYCSVTECHLNESNFVFTSNICEALFSKLVTIPSRDEVYR